MDMFKRHLLTNDDMSVLSPLYLKQFFHLSARVVTRVFHINDIYSSLKLWCIFIYPLFLTCPSFGGSLSYFLFLTVMGFCEHCDHCIYTLVALATFLFLRFVCVYVTM